MNPLEEQRAQALLRGEFGLADTIGEYIRHREADAMERERAIRESYEQSARSFYAYTTTAGTTQASSATAHYAPFLSAPSAWRLTEDGIRDDIRMSPPLTLASMREAYVRAGWIDSEPSKPEPKDPIWSNLI